MQAQPVVETFDIANDLPFRLRSGGEDNFGLTLSGYLPGHAVAEGGSRRSIEGMGDVRTPSTPVYVVNDPCGNAGRSITRRYRVLVDPGTSAELDIVVNRGDVGHCLDD